MIITVVHAIDKFVYVELLCLIVHYLQNQLSGYLLRKFKNS